MHLEVEFAKEKNKIEKSKEKLLKENLTLENFSGIVIKHLIEQIFL